MSLFSEIIRLVVSILVAWLVTRLPLVVLPRISIRPLELIDHPYDPEIDESLILQILRVRRAYWASIPFGLIPLILGILMIIQSPSSVGFGLIIGSSWVILSRLVPFDLDHLSRFPYSMNLVHELNRIRIEKYPCCKIPKPVWSLDAVKCLECSHIFLNHPRPDLGRKRSDGVLFGALRIMVLDGHPFTESNSEISLEEE